jgi:poly(hydroxyalkanoate) depolymerase family esterase
MLNFKAGALRPATDGARPESIAAANDLVRRTLAQHGLWTDAGEMGATLPQPGAMQGLPNLMEGLPGLMEGMNRLPSARGGLRPAPRIDLPKGASFQRATQAGICGSRDYRLYVPASASDGVAGIVLMLHGCTQSPEDFATGTGMNALAETHRLVIIYPEQARGANAQSCWNWFSKGDQRRDRGEPEILAGMTRKAMAEHGVPTERVFVAGLSAGAAMAVILGETYPDVFAAVGAHSGLPYGSARDVPSAFAAMGGDLQHAASAPPAKQAVRTIVFHGTADRTVNPANGAEIARRAGTGVHAVESTETGTRGGRGFRRTLSYDAGGQVLTEHWVIDGLGHAWSGGNSAGSYADPVGPDASSEMVRFFLDSKAEGAQ